MMKINKSFHFNMKIKYGFWYSYKEKTNENLILFLKIDAMY